MKSTERFSDRVENYVKFRPSYPLQLIDTLAQQCSLGSDSSIADIGSGTGKLTELLLPTGATVHAVEPNREMREAAEHLLQHNQQFVSIAGDSCYTGLESQSIDLIVAAQAIHWFDAAPTKLEFTRILKPAGHIGLIWNERDTGSAFQKDYDHMLTTHCEEYSKVNHRNITDSSIEEFFNPYRFRKFTFTYAQHFDLQGFLGRMYSSSYTPAPGSTAAAALDNAATTLFQSHAKDNRIEFTYQTNLFLAKLM